MNFSQMSMFIEVTRCGSLSEAARRNNLTQPAVTRKMQRLEKELGVTLFERGESNQLGLTAAGREFLTFAQKALLDYATLREKWQAQRDEVAGILKLAASTTPGEFIVPRLLSGFTARYPNVNPAVSIMDSAEVEAAVANYEYDAGFVGNLSGEQGLASQNFWEDEIVLAVPAAHSLASGGRREVELAELENIVLLNREQGSGTLQSVHRILAGQGKELPPHHVKMTLGSTHAIISAVASGLGSGFVSVLASEEIGERVVALRIKDVPLRRPRYIIHAPNRPQISLLVREFLNYVLAGTAFAAHDDEDDD
jgi:DNA-binding transcriptional LysR family regulator